MNHYTLTETDQLAYLSRSTISHRYIDVRNIFKYFDFHVQIINLPA